MVFAFSSIFIFIDSIFFLRTCCLGTAAQSYRAVATQCVRAPSFDVLSVINQLSLRKLPC